MAKGLVQYSMEPENLRVVMEEGGGRWGPPYKGMYDSLLAEAGVPALACDARAGRRFASPGSLTAAAGEVLVTTMLARMMHRVLVDNWEAEKAVEEAHNKVVEIYARFGGVGMGDE